MAYTKGDPIAAQHINGFLSSALRLYGVGTGDRGYGQTTITATPVAVGDIIKSNTWSDLRRQMSVISMHQNNLDIPLLNPLSEVAVSQPVVALTNPPTQYDIPAALQQLDNNRLTAHLSSMTLSTNAHSATRSTAWGQGNATIKAVVMINFDTENAARYFFNSGGEIRFRLNHPNGNSVQDTQWRTALQSRVGTITISAHKTSASGTGGTGWFPVPNAGYYEYSSSGSGTVIVNGTGAGTGAYNTNSVVISVKSVNRAGVNGANGRSLEVTITLRDTHTGYLDVVSSGTNVVFDVLRATRLTNIPSPSFVTVSNWV